MRIFYGIERMMSSFLQLMESRWYKENGKRHNLKQIVIKTAFKHNIV